MRFDKLVFFQRVNAVYDKSTGDYVETVENVKARRASVTQTGADMLAVVYGQTPQESLTIRVQNPVGVAFDYIQYAGRRYKVDKRVTLRMKEAYIVTEVK